MSALELIETPLLPSYQEIVEGLIAWARADQALQTGEWLGNAAFDAAWTARAETRLALLALAERLVVSQGKGDGDGEEG